MLMRTYETAKPMSDIEEDSDGLLDGVLGDGPLADKPLLRLLLLKQLFGGSAQPSAPQLPLARAMMSQNTPPPLIRAMMMRYAAQNGYGGPPLLPGMIASNNQADPSLLRSLFLFRLLGAQMGKKVLDEIERRVEDKTVYSFGSVIICDCPMEYIDDDGVMKGFNLDLINEVCKEAGKKCTIQYVPSTKCYAHQGEHSSAGEGMYQNHSCFYFIPQTESLRHVSTLFLKTNSKASRLQIYLRILNRK
ncbi:uncharacterized protein LOC144432662 [Glandiceps talaboti]